MYLCTYSCEYSCMSLNTDYSSDLESLREQAEEGARMGYTGKQVIHPDQLPIVMKAFSPSPEQVKWAEGLIDAFHYHQQSGQVSH